MGEEKEKALENEQRGGERKEAGRRRWGEGRAGGRTKDSAEQHYPISVKAYA